MALDVPAGWGQLPLEAKPVNIDLSTALEQNSKLNQLAADTAGTQARTALEMAQLPREQAMGVIASNQAALDATATQDAQIARVASLVDPNDPDAGKKWDEAMQGLVDKGVGTAKQFLGKYSPALATRVTAAYSAKAPSEAAAALGAGGAPSDAASPDQATLWNQQLSQMPLDQLQKTAQHLDQTKDALVRVMNSPNPAQQWDVEAKQLGRPDLVGHYSSLQAQTLWANTAPLDNVIKQVIAQKSAGLPGPQPPKGEFINGGDGSLYRINPDNTLTKMTEAKPKFSVVPTALGPNGEPIVLNETTGETHAAGALTRSDFVHNLTGSESAGVATAKNPNSTATGTGQFIEKTWLHLIKANRPDLAQGKSDQQILALRTDGELSSQMTDAYAAENAGALAQEKLPVTALTLAMAHKLGPGNGPPGSATAGAMTVLNAAPDTPMSKLMSPAALKANPQLANHTAGDYVASLAQKFPNQPVAGLGNSGLTQVSYNGAADPNAAHGDAYLQRLPPQIATQVKAIAEGRQAIPTGYALTKPDWKQMMTYVGQYDPTYDSASQPARVAAYKQFTGNGKAAQVASSGNRLAYHLNDLYSDSKALSGPDLGWSPLSNLATGAAQSFQQAAVARYNAVLPFISGELQKLTKNGTSTEGETNKIMANLRPGQPADARLAAIQQVVQLAQGQFKPFRDQWDSIFGPDRPPPVDFSPETNAIFDAIGSDKGPVSVDPRTGRVRAATAGIPAGAPTATGPNGKVWWNGQQWVPAAA